MVTRLPGWTESNHSYHATICRRNPLGCSRDVSARIRGTCVNGLAFGTPPALSVRTHCGANRPNRTARRNNMIGQVGWQHGPFTFRAE